MVTVTITMTDLLSYNELDYVTPGRYRVTAAARKLGGVIWNLGTGSLRLSVLSETIAAHGYVCMHVLQTVYAQRMEAYVYVHVHVHVNLF